MTEAHRVMVVYGTRPEAIKLAPLIKELQGHPDVDPILVTTGQHPEMVAQVHDDYGLGPAHWALRTFTQGQDLSSLMARILSSLQPVLEQAVPDVVVVQGDTTSCIAGALAAMHLQIPVVHLEAGMRSNDRRSPFPEESYRRLVAQISDLHLAASPSNKKALLAEGVAPEIVVNVGSTALDALAHALGQPADFEGLADRLGPGRLVVITCHRRESWGEPMRRVGRALYRVASSHPDDTFVLSAHPNPIVRDALIPELQDLPNIVLTEPLGYNAFAELLRRAHVLVTDSGGVQAEAPSLQVPTLVLRDTTEYTETLDAGSARLVGTHEQTVVDAMTALLDDPEAHDEMRIGYSPYGDGKASIRAAAAIINFMRTGAHGLKDLVPEQMTGIAVARADDR